MPWRRKQNQLPVVPQTVTISGVHNSAVAVGAGNYTVQGSAMESAPAQTHLDESIAAVRRLIQAHTDGTDHAVQATALGQVTKLDQAARADPPDEVTMASVRDWFVQHLPAIVPAVLDVVAHPSVETALKAASDIASEGSA